MYCSLASFIAPLASKADSGAADVNKLVKFPAKDLIVDFLKSSLTAFENPLIKAFSVRLLPPEAIASAAVPLSIALVEPATFPPIPRGFKR